MTWGLEHKHTVTWRLVSFPSTTSRTSLCVTSYATIKKNEMRVCFYLAISSLRKRLRRNITSFHELCSCYTYVQKSWYLSIEHKCSSPLGKSIALHFPKLFSARQCLQIIHSLVHIADTKSTLVHFILLLNSSLKKNLVKFLKRIFCFIERVSFFIALLICISKSVKRYVHELIQKSSYHIGNILPRQTKLKKTVKYA